MTTIIHPPSNTQGDHHSTLMNQNSFSFDQGVAERRVVAAQHSSPRSSAGDAPYQFTRSSSFRVEHTRNSEGFSLVDSTESSPPHESTCQARDLEYDTVEKRLRSFRNYPLDAKADPHDLSENGLYYVGTSDKVRCAYCRGQMFNWEEGDTAFLEHLKHFPLCHFIMAKDKRQKWEVARKQGNPVTDHMSRSVPSNDNVFRSKREKPEEEAVSNSLAKQVTMQMGFEEDLVNKALRYLKKKNPVKQITTADLLDIVFEMEDNPDSFHEELEDRVTSDHGFNTSLDAGVRQDEALVSENSNFSLAHVGAPARAPVIHRQAPITPVPEPLQTRTHGAQFAAGNLQPSGTFRIVQSGQRSELLGGEHQITAGSPLQRACHSESRGSQENSTLLVAKGLHPSAMRNSSGMENSLGEESLAERKTDGDDVDSLMKSAHAILNHEDLPNRQKDDGSSCDKEENKDDVENTKGTESKQTVKKLKEEQNRLRQNVVCNICHRQKINVLFLPCRHLVTCENCSEMDDCSRCGKQIIGTVKIFLV